jgi:hypothetical protein
VSEKSVKQKFTYGKISESRGYIKREKEKVKRGHYHFTIFHIATTSKPQL